VAPLCIWKKIYGSSNAQMLLNLNRDSNELGTFIITRSKGVKNLENRLNLSNISKILESLDTLDFDVFDFQKQTEDRELSCMTTLLLHKHSLYTGLKINFDKFLKFIERIQSGYNNVKYHNKTHAADVTQTLYSIVIQGGWISKGKLDNIDIVSIILS
jgi:hypothetical protein